MINNVKKLRPPIIVILGHVDHGKTTLLDFIRKSNIAEKEYAGITQKIQAFNIEIKNKSFTFIDTPGHELFSSLRKRGSQIADLGILVVAADDGIKPQTEESLNFLKELKIPYVVAINKIDRPNAQPEKVKKDLANLGVVLEEWGGEVPCFLISAKTGEGVDVLLDGISVLSEIYEFSYTEDEIFGYVLETYKDLKIGNQVMIILKNGILKLGDEIYTQTTKAKIKKITSTDNKDLKEIYPSIPAIVLGFEDLPLAGEEISKDIKITQTQYFRNLSIGKGSEEVKFLIKAENFGSIEAILKILEKFSQDYNKKIKIIEASIGDLIKVDVDFIKTYHPHLILFNTKIPNFLKIELVGEPIKIVSGKSIYEIEECLKELFEEKEKQVLSYLKIIKIFSQKSSKITLGGKVEGVFKLKDKVVIKDENGKIIASGIITSLEKDKVPCQQVENSLCGMVIQGSNLDKVKEGYEIFKY
jgi:translation initiation factor IF-2